MNRADRERYRATGFPKDPANCAHRRLLPVSDLTTGKPIEGAGVQCWYCGTRFAEVAK